MITLAIIHVDAKIEGSMNRKRIFMIFKKFVLMSIIENTESAKVGTID